ncbi:hypothetical protein BKA65DRAFT_512262 [Rhexocercosporidium sp. MPI-PUGE-AT-0058]|nr:hypothetical protein BKA65DRAFT_512262 [Rhexocercosporidium sp. MPI-PUGE-AT-0058]
MRSWRKHLTGLKEIVQLRGGIGCLDPNIFLRTMLSCIDISGSRTLDEVPNFPFPAILAPSVMLDLHSPNVGLFFQSYLDILTFNFTNNFGLVDILVDLNLESLHLQHEMRQNKGKVLMDSMYICDYINPILHRLLSLPRQDDSSSTATMAEVIRLAAIL